MHKLYLVSFIIEERRCFKIGITSNFDVTKRFQKHINNGNILALRYIRVPTLKVMMMHMKRNNC